MTIMPSGETSPFDALRRIDPSGGEYWSARDMVALMGYEKWERFEGVIERARVAIANAGHDRDQHASRIREASGRTARTNYHLSRYGAYIVAMNGDPSKEQVAKAQTYFAGKAREAELASAAPQPPAVMPTYADALRGWADELERRQAVEAERDALAPAARSWEVLASSGHDFSVRDAAYILNRDPNINTGERRLFHKIRVDWRMVSFNDRPYSQHGARLTLKPRSYEHPRTGEQREAAPQVRVTYEGLKYMHRKLAGVADVARLVEEFRQTEDGPREIGGAA